MKEYISYCLNCNKEIVNNRKSKLKKFCSNECQYEYRWGQKIKNKKFGKLTVLKRVSKSEWLCLCDCGNTTIVKTTQLTSGKTQSCGCIAKMKHSNNMKNNRKIKKFNEENFVDNTNLSLISSNKPFKSNKSTGIRGVYKKKNGSYTSQICFNKKIYRLGTYSNIEDAIKARQEAEEKYYKPILEKYNRK